MGQGVKPVGLNEGVELMVVGAVNSQEQFSHALPGTGEEGLHRPAQLLEEDLSGQRVTVGM